MDYSEQSSPCSIHRYCPRDLHARVTYSVVNWPSWSLFSNNPEPAWTSSCRQGSFILKLSKTCQRLLEIVEPFSPNSKSNLSQKQSSPYTNPHLESPNLDLRLSMQCNGRAKHVLSKSLIGWLVHFLSTYHIPDTPRIQKSLSNAWLRDDLLDHCGPLGKSLLGDDGTTLAEIHCWPQNKSMLGAEVVSIGQGRVETFPRNTIPSRGIRTEK